MAAAFKCDRCRRLLEWVPGCSEIELSTITGVKDNGDERGLSGWTWELCPKCYRRGPGRPGSGRRLRPRGAHSVMNCERDGCGVEATGATGIAFYPMPALMRYYRDTRPLNVLVLTLHLCDLHRLESTANELVPEGVREQVARRFEASSGTVVDRTACKVVMVPLDDPLYLRLIQAGGEARAPL